MSTIIYDFQNESDFNLANNGAIESSKGVIGLIDNPNQLFEQTFDSDAGFTYNSSLAEFIAGSLNQKDQTPADSIIGSKYNSSFDANWSKVGSVSAIINGTPLLASGKLRCFGAHGVYYNIAPLAKGAIKFKYTPNYTTEPASNVNLVGFQTGVSSRNRMTLTHSPTGTADNLRLTIDNSLGNSVILAQAIGGAFQPTAGQEYEMELNWDSSTGATRLFINGVLHGSRNDSAWTFDTGTTARLYIGANPSIYNVSEGEFDDVLIFNEVQHTSGYAPGYSIPSFIYSGNTVAIPPFSYTGIGTIQAVESSNIVETGTPRYIVAGLYWDGSAWVASDGSYAQANTSSSVVSNLPSLTVQGAENVPVSIIFEDSNSQSSVDTISVTVTGQKRSPTGYIEPSQGLQAAALSDYSLDVTNTANTAAKTILRIDNQLKWFNTVNSAWEDSDGTINQANTDTEIKDNLSALNLGKNSEVFIRWVLTTTSNTETPQLNESTVVFTFGLIETLPVTCNVVGYYKDASGNPISDAKLRFEVVTTRLDNYREANKNIIRDTYIEVETDANGYFSVDLIRSSQYETQRDYKLTIIRENKYSYLGNSAELTFAVPEATFKDITDLLP